MHFDPKKTGRVKRLAGKTLLAVGAAAVLCVPETMVSCGTGAELLRATLLGNVGTPLLAALLGSLILLNAPRKKQ